MCLERKLEQDVLRKLKQRRLKRFWSRLVSVMMCVVVFCTTYALILPAITKETDTFCGLEAHEHTSDCFPQQGDLICEFADTEIHTHTEECHPRTEELPSCGLEEAEPHTHTDECISPEGKTLSCHLTETEGHAHTEECLYTEEKTLSCTQAETEGHVHIEECQRSEEKILVCPLAETEGHAHTEACQYTEERILCCTLAETQGHTHTDACTVTETYLICGLEETEEHVHEGGCYTEVTSNVCGMAEAAAHMHIDSCYTVNAGYSCGLQESAAHFHTDECYSITVSYGCGQEEKEAHFHGDACYNINGSYSCGLEEEAAHAHGDDCYTIEYTCGLTETEGHAHSDECYLTLYDCGLDAQVHTHTDDCYDKPAALICTLEENDGHTHGVDCFEGEPACELEEHEHTLACYSDPEADVESAAVWESTFAHVTLTGDPATDVVAIAQTQIGYTESTRNYQVWEDNSIHGYTRYGAWYGVPYGDWCGMFASFCLRYAGVNSIPINYGVRPWISDLSARGMYYRASETQPQKGNLIFFDWEGDGLADHVGIVAEVHEAQEHTGGSVTAIEGNSSNCVQYVYYKTTDSVILGYGLLPGQERIPVKAEEPKEGEFQINTDINLGPVVILTAQAVASEEGTEEDVMMFALAPRSTTDLKEYLGRDNVKGSFYLTLTDNDNKELLPDENGNLIAEPGQPYKLTLTVNSPNGFAPGSYTYQLPAGLTVQNGSGDLIADNKQLGSWSIDPNGLITLVFNQTANNYTNAILSAQMGITFEATDTIIEFDGEIKVVIKEPPDEEEVEIEMAKWGGSDDGTSITWQVRVVGHEGANIAGTLVTDTITSDNHSYTDQNRENTIVVNASGAGNVWHMWILRVNDPNLIYWTDTGWQYRMPATVYCEQCKQTITLDDEWTYDFYYTTTPETSDSNGTVHYTNRAEFGDYDKDGIAQIKYGTGPTGVDKSGSFQGDAEGGKFVWTVKVQLPGMSAGQKAVYNWRLTDGMNLKDANGQEVDGEIVRKPHNDMDLSVVTITRNGVTTTLNRIEEATDTDEIVWDSESAGWNGEIQRIEFYCRCHCTEANCQIWQNGKCNEGHINGFCACWTIPDDVEIVFTYETDAKTIIEYYGENGKVITNLVELWYGNNWQHGSGAEVEIPGIFEKTLTDDFTSNDPNHPEKKYIASYTITLNEAKLNLSPNGTPITIIDEMTDSLAYISGSMVITEENLYGSTRVLTYGTDYTLTYDGSDRADNLHVLTIVLNNPQPAMYTLKYDTSIVIKADLTAAIPYQNWARVTILGKNLTADTDRLIYADINYAAKTYQVDIVKTADGTDVLLPGATFGLYNETGGLIDSQTTDENGKLTFITSITDGIILLEHIPYYIQEIEAPEGFVLDTTKYWFYFCDQGEGCTEGSGIKEEHTNAVRIPGAQIHTFNMKNTMMGYELPATGGTGTTLYTMAGLLLMMSSAAYLMYRPKARRREEI